jgi:chromosomal replication initiation ATPase DnaA
MHRTIEGDAQHALQLLNLDISDVLLSRGTRSIMDKKKLLYCYLRLECGYSWHEIGAYCNKDHTTILKVVNKATKDGCIGLLLYNTTNGSKF